MPETTPARPSVLEPLSAFDLRLRSLDREPGEPIYLCSGCSSHAQWSVWLHTPEWGSQGGATYVLCTDCALTRLRVAATSKGSTPLPPDPLATTLCSGNEHFNCAHGKDS